MADWTKILSRGDVEDRRSMAPVAAGGAGIVGIAFLVINFLVTGQVDVGQVLQQIQNVQVAKQQNVDKSQFEGIDSYETFSSTVLGSNNDMWEDLFSQTDRQYDPPKLVLFRTSTQSACGIATSEVGPHYCPADRTIYLDETFFEELKNMLGAQGGDVAEAYVIAHEVGHHAQNEFGISGEVQAQMESDTANANSLSVKLELQADCFAGLWVNSIKDLGVFSPEEVYEAIDAAEAVGDDRIQKKLQGQINPETWTHGSSEQRVEWFNRGYNSGQLAMCDTFD